MQDKIFRIGSHEYQKVDPGVFPVPFNELRDIRLIDLLPHSTILITDLPKSKTGYQFEISVTNGGDEGDYQYFTIAYYISPPSGPNADAHLNRIRRMFLPLVEKGLLPDPLTSTQFGFNVGKGISYIPNYAYRGTVIIRDEITPIITLMKRLASPVTRIFICYASEDSVFAQNIAEYLVTKGNDVWLDKYEIKVGDSIVEKINQGLADASHLAILLSKSSVNKPWAQKELSVTLMRQLKDQSVRIIPILIDDCQVPPVLLDIRYADCRVNPEEGYKAILAALLQSENT
jgi:hypothetical protein